jgi:threonine dehydrogenase-like Zn-dependent dehydrogenase
MRAVTWQGKRTVSVETVPDPVIQNPTDAIIRVTSSGLCGSDLHLYEVFGPFLDPGDILGHEPMGIVEAVGSEVASVQVGDRVVVPFGIACGSCFFCGEGLQSQCETTQVREHGSGAALFGYTKLYGQVPGGQAELLRVPHADYGAVKVPEGPPDDRFLFLSDVLPTAWQAVQYSGIEPGQSLVVVGLGPIGEMAVRVARQLGIEHILAIDLVPDRLDRARSLGVHVIDLLATGSTKDIVEEVHRATAGRGADAVIDAVGMEAHGSAGAKVVQRMTDLLPDALSSRLMKIAGVDRLAALHLAAELVRRGGTISIVGVYGGESDPMPMMTLFDKQVQVRMGQANVHRWIPDILPLLTDADPLGVDTFATHHRPLNDAPWAYEQFQHKTDGVFKVVFRP